MSNATFDLEERLLDYAANVIDLVDSLPLTRSGNHVGGQLLRSGTSPLPNHGEAQAAESRADFVHKMRICLKELRESRRWLKLICRSSRLRSPTTDEAAVALTHETEDLIRIFFTSVRTANSKGPMPKPPAKGADAAFGRASVRPRLRSGRRCLPLNVGR